MKAIAYFTKADGKGKNVTTNETLPSPVDSFLFQALVEKNPVASSVLASLWGEYIASKEGTLDHLEISDFTTMKMVKGESVEYAGKAVIYPLNLTDIFTGVNAWKQAEREVKSKFATVKTLLSQSVKVEAIGYEAGKRGRRSKAGMSEEQATIAARKALGLA